MANSEISRINFEDLTARLLRDLAYLVKSGETTERRLASVVGISQPHLHNILNGTRKLTSTIADQAMRRLDWSILELLEAVEVESAADRYALEFRHGRAVPFFNPGAGPGVEFRQSPDGERRVLGAWLSKMADPVAVALTADPEMEGVLDAGDVLLIDCAPCDGSQIEPESLYVVRTDRGALVRWVRYSSKGLYLISVATRSNPLRWARAETHRNHRWRRILGKVVAKAHPPKEAFHSFFAAEV